MLYQTLAEHWPAFLEQAEETGGLPRFVVREFEEYLRCGILGHGCLHLVCRCCGYSQLVARSCKRRGFCPSCCGRRMADTAVHLEQGVLPAVRIRHWICTLPWGLRALLGYDRELCAEVVRAFATELDRSLRWRAKRELDLDSVARAHTGSVVAIQRTDSALRLNVHLHVLSLDGVYVRDPAGELVFHELPTPTHAEVAEVARRTAERIEQILRAHGRSLDPELAQDEPHLLCLDEPGLAACYAAAAQGISLTGDRAGRPTLRLIVPRDKVEAPAGEVDADPPVAEVRGVNVHAKQVVDGRDRNQLERLCRYITRPPVGQDRLERRADGRLELTLKKAWRDGTRALVLEPHELITRLIAAIPPPGFHLLRYFGVLSSHSSLRAQVVPEPPADCTAHQPPPAAGDQLPLFAEGDADERPARRKRWAWLLKHVYAADLDNCPRCGGPMRWLDFVTAPDELARLLAAHGLGPQPPPRAQEPPRGQLRLPLGA